MAYSSYTLPANKCTYARAHTNTNTHTCTLTHLALSSIAPTAAHGCLTEQNYQNSALQSFRSELYYI